MLYKRRRYDKKHPSRYSSAGTKEADWWQIGITVLILINEYVIHSVRAQASGYYDDTDPYESLRWDSHCERIRIPVCLNVAYNMAFYPNRIDNQKQDNVDLEAR